MTQHSLFPDLPTQTPVERTQHGAQWRVGNWNCRNWHGYFQSREIGARNWRFQVPWFSNDDVTCTVYVLDDQGEITGQDGIPIDDQGRITIMGRKYSRSHWDH